MLIKYTAWECNFSPKLLYIRGVMRGRVVLRCAQEGFLEKYKLALSDSFCSSTGRRPFFSLSAEPVPWFLLLSAPNSKMPSNKAPLQSALTPFCPCPNMQTMGVKNLIFIQALNLSLPTSGHQSVPIPPLLNIPTRIFPTYILQSFPSPCHTK